MAQQKQHSSGQCRTIMLFSFLSLIFFTLYGLFLKISSYKKCNPIAINLNILFFASLVAFFFFLANLYQYHIKVGLFGLCGGTFFFVCTLLFLYSLKDGKISTCWTIFNLGMVIPVIFSIFLWKEAVDPKKILGFALICFSIILIGQENQ